MSMSNLLDRAILAVLKTGPLTGVQLVRKFRGHWGFSRIFNIPIETFSAHLDALRKENRITCSRPEDPAQGEWCLSGPSFIGHP